MKRKNKEVQAKKLSRKDALFAKHVAKGVKRLSKKYNKHIKKNALKLDISSLCSKHNYRFPYKLERTKLTYNDIVEEFCYIVSNREFFNKNSSEMEYVFKLYIKHHFNNNKNYLYLLDKLIYNYEQLGRDLFFDQYKDIKKYLKKEFNNGTLKMFEDSLGGI